MKRKSIILLISVLIIILTVIGIKLYFSTKNNTIDDNSEFFYAKEVDSKTSFDEKKLKSATVYYNSISDRNVSLQDIEEAYIQKNDLYKDYLDLYNEYYVEAVRDSLDLIARREYDCFFYSELTDAQKETVDNIFYSEQELVNAYYNDESIKLCDLKNNQQLEFYYAYTDSAYVINDAKMEVVDTNKMLLDYPYFHEEYADLSDEVKLRRFFGREKDGEIEFDEDELALSAFYYNLLTESDVTVEELERAYKEKNDLFYSYLGYDSLATDGLEKSMMMISFYENQSFLYEAEDIRKLEKKYMELQEMVTDYYGDARIMFYSLNVEQREEVYKAYLDSEYVMDDSIMGTSAEHYGSAMENGHGLITYKKGNNIVIRHKSQEGEIYTIEGKYKDIEGLSEGDYVEYVYHDHHNFSSNNTYTNVQFEGIEKQEKPKNFNVDSYYAQEHETKTNELLFYIVLTVWAACMIALLAVFLRIKREHANKRLETEE